MKEITQILQNWRDSSDDERNNVLSQLYAELRIIARGQMMGERNDMVVQPTVIANEAYLRLVKINQMDYSDRAHFFATAATLMRRVLVDFARSRSASKRDGGSRVTLTSNFSEQSAKPFEILVLDEGLNRLKEIDVQIAEILEARYFGGLTVDEVATLFELSRATVTRKSQIGIAWLRDFIDANQ